MKRGIKTLFLATKENPALMSGVFEFGTSKRELALLISR